MSSIMKRIAGTIDNPYICSRCNFKSYLKGNIRQHFGRVKPCYNRNRVELTPEIKETVLRDHVYHIPQEKTIMSIVTQNNTLNNFVVKLDIVDKLNKLLEHDNKNMVGFRRYAEMMFYNDVDKLENSDTEVEFDTYRIDESRIYQLVDAVTQMEPDNYETINSMFDQRTNRLNLFFAKNWDSYLTQDGINKIVEVMIESYFSAYELYLVKKMFSPNVDVFNYSASKKYLEEYYSFIAIFGLTPDVTEKMDSDLIGQQLRENSPYRISEECNELYKCQKNSLTDSKIKNVKRELIRIVKHNTTYKTDEINKEISRIIQTDKQFKHTIMGETTN